MLRSVFALLFLVCSCFHAVAQSGTGSISGKVVDSLQQPLEGATILVRSATNNTAVKTALTENKGSFLLEKIKEGSYQLIISMSGFAKDSSNITLTAEKNTINTGTIKLVPLSKDLQGITITAQRPPVERKIDRTVVNVDQMISAAGSTALEVLEKSRQTRRNFLEPRAPLLAFLDLERKHTLAQTDNCCGQHFLPNSQRA